MPLRRLVHLDSQSLTAYVWSSGSLRDEGRFPLDATGQASFASYLHASRRSLFYVLADVPEEAFNFELVPFIQGADRQALIERKLKQYFYGSPLSTSLSLGREKGGRRDERMLFTALTRPQFFEPWLKLFGAAESQLAGVFSVPLVSRALASRLKLAQDRDAFILITLGSGGIRQLFFEGGNLRFSRLSSAPTGGPAEIARTCAAESAKLYQYLVSQRIVTRGMTLPCVFLVHPAWRAEMAAECQSTTELRFEFADLVAAAAACGLREPPADSSADRLFLHMLAKAPPREQFAGADERHMYRLWQLRTGMLGAGAVVLLGCLLYAGRQVHEIHELRQQSTAVAARTAEDARRYSDILRGLPPMPTTLDNLRAVVVRYEGLERRTELPAAMFQRISRALERSPRIELERIEWQLGIAPEAAPGGAPAPRGAAAPAAPDGSGEMFASAVITASLPPSLGSERRTILETIDAFVGELRAEPELRVSIVRLPFDVESGQTLRSAETGAIGSESPRFIVRMARKL